MWYPYFTDGGKVMEIPGGLPQTTQVRLAAKIRVRVGGKPRN